MNDDLIFWRNWSTKVKMSFGAVLSLIFLLLAFVFFSKSKGLENSISWDVVTELKEKAIQTPALFLEGYSFSGASPLWYVSEHYAPSLLKVNTCAYLILLGSILAGLSLILAGLSRLQGIWFLVGALVLGLVLVNFKTESLFLVSKNWPFLIVFSVAGLTYYLTNSFARKLDIVKTVGIWAIVWTVFVFAIQKFSLINEPLVSLAAYGLLGAIFLTVLFIFFISHEILAGLYTLVSENSVKGKNGLTQVLVVTVVFMVNAILIYLENANRIDKSAYIFSPVIIYVLSLGLGIWGFRKLSEQREWFSFQGVGAWIFSGLAIVSTATLGFAYATSNTPLIEFLEDYISICTLAVGLCFFVYVLVNFLPAIKEGLPFAKVMYKPPFSRFLFARIAAGFIVFFLFSLKNRYSFFQFKAGLNNSIADFYLVEGDLKAAETYYKSAATYDLNNQKSNLALASLAEMAQDKINSVYFYSQAEKKTSSPQSIMGLSNSLEEQDLYFDALFLLKEGINHFPEEYRLYTNLARLQAKAGVTDSVLINLDEALRLNKDGNVENTNFLAFWVENGKPEKLTEMRALAGKASGYSFKANNMALGRILGEEVLFEDFEMTKDSALDMARAAYLFNAMSAPSLQNKTQINGQALRNLQEKGSNDNFFEQLSWAYANQEYYRETKLSGLKQMVNLAESSSKLNALYNQTLGLWLFREGAYSSALNRLEKAGDLASVELIEQSEIKENLSQQLQKQAVSLQQGLSLDNYKEVLNKAPLNPWVIKNVSDFLSKQKKTLDAYNVALYGLDFLGDSPLVLEVYIKRALELRMFEYAEDALVKLKPLVKAEKYAKVQNDVNLAKNKKLDF